MTRLIDGLLNLAKTDYQKKGIRMQKIHLGELLLDVRQTILKAHHNYHINMVFDIMDGDAASDRMITVFGNLYLLSIAATNLIENNCKYSSNRQEKKQIVIEKLKAFFEKYFELIHRQCSPVALVFCYKYRN